MSAAQPGELREAMAEALSEIAPHGSLAWTNRATDALLPIVTAHAERVARERAAEELDDVAALIDRGPTFSMPPSIYSALVRERAQDIRDALAADDQPVQP